MAWVTHSEEDLKLYTDFYAWVLAQGLLYKQSCVLLAGNVAIDRLKMDDINKYGDKFIIQLNHHLARRLHQDCHWLVCRAGCNYKPEDLTERHIDTIKIVSTSINKEMCEPWYRFAKKHNKLFLPFFEGTYYQLNPFGTTLEWCNRFWKDIETNPYAGMLALEFALQFHIKDIELIGFDFYQRPSGGGWEERRGCHDTFSQIAWFKNKYVTDMRIVVNDKLKDLLKLERPTDILKAHKLKKEHELDE